MHDHVCKKIHIGRINTSHQIWHNLKWFEAFVDIDISGSGLDTRSSGSTHISGSTCRARTISKFNYLRMLLRNKDKDTYIVHWRERHLVRPIDIFEEFNSVMIFVPPDDVNYLLSIGWCHATSELRKAGVLFLRRNFDPSGLMLIPAANNLDIFLHHYWKLRRVRGSIFTRRYYSIHICGVIALTMEMTVWTSAHWSMWPPLLSSKNSRWCDASVSTSYLLSCFTTIWLYPWLACNIWDSDFIDTTFALQQIWCAARKRSRESKP